MKLPILSVRIQYEHDVVTARQRTRQLAEALGFDPQQQTRLATAVSEIARNAFSYAKGGKAEFFLEGSTPPQLFGIRVVDKGPGIADLDQILNGQYRSTSGMGLGIAGAQRLMDTFRIDTDRRTGTSVLMGKLLPRRAEFVKPAMAPALIEKLEREKPRDILDEFREQNQELIRTLDELRRRQEELISVNRELEDTNRGVVALYAELDDKASHLRRADEVKSRFLSNMSHEFRTPLNSILALSRLLLDRTDGELTSEQEIQVGFIRKSAESLYELVNDLLDLAKVEAGKVDVRAAEFQVDALFGALRGMLRPLLATLRLSLVFEPCPDGPVIYSDEGKVSQILRNFISNALKFTESGEVRVSAECEEDDGREDGGTVTFRVRDTGIGIEPEHLKTIFQEYTQIDHPIQRKVRGTGLGLPLSKRLAELLGGKIEVESTPGQGSIFSLRIPIKFASSEPAMAVEPQRAATGDRDTVLLVEDHFETRLIYESYFRETPWSIASARSVREANSVLNRLTPAAIVLDVALAGEDSWDLLARLKSDGKTAGIPIVVATNVDDESKALALGADVYFAKPVSGEKLRETIRRLTRGRVVVLADDEEISRYLLRQIFGHQGIRFVEARNGAEALEVIRSEKPDLVVMDVSMPEVSGLEAIEVMQSDEVLRRIPVIVATSLTLSGEEQRGLEKRVLGIFSKAALSRGADAELASLLEPVGLGDLLGSKLTNQPREFSR